MPHTMPKLPLMKDRLQHAMNERSLTVYELSKQTEISSASLHYWLNDDQLADNFKTTAPTLGDWLAMSMILQVPVEWLSNGFVKQDPVGWPDLEISGLLPFAISIGQLATYSPSEDTKIYVEVKGFTMINGTLMVGVQSIDNREYVELPLSQVNPYVV